MSQAIFLGSKAAGLEALRAIRSVAEDRLLQAITFNDSSDSRSCLSDFKEYCAEHSIELFVIDPKSLDDHLNTYSGAKIFVVGWYAILSSDLLKRHDFFGVHYSALPKYRGNAPLVWQIINGEQEIGLSLFKFSEGMDDGDIVAQCTFPLLESDDVSTALDKANQLSAAMLRSNVASIISNTALLISQDHEQATYCSLRQPEDGRINWNADAKDIVNFVRAQTNPYPGAFTKSSDGDQIKIFKCELDTRVIYAPTGAIFERGLDFVVIKAGRGAIRVKQAQKLSDCNIRSIFPSIKERLL